MNVEEIRTIAGPNIHTHQPTLVMKLQLSELYKRESKEFAGFNERLLELLPGLHEHYCGLGRRGGFVERLQGGTYFGHIVEHVAIELSERCGIGVHYGKTRHAGTPGLYNVIVRYRNEGGMRFLLHEAVKLVDALVKEKAFDLDKTLTEAERIIADANLGPSTAGVVEAAERRGIPWTRLSEGNLIAFGYGKNRRLLQASIGHDTNCIAVDVACDKELTKQLLERAAIPVPRSVTARTEAEAVQALDKLRLPVVVKPLDGRQGKGVSLGLKTPEEVRQAFHFAQELSASALVEEMFDGQDYRVLVVGGRVVAAAHRQPAHVTGDGQHTIAELIALENENPLRGLGHEKPMTRIQPDEIMTAHLSRLGLNLNSVPEAGEAVFLSHKANLSTGGSARDVTDELHPDTARVCERAARIIGLDICGIDLILPDARQSIHHVQGGVIEVNAAPGLRMHLHPSEGKRREVGEAILDLLYPTGSKSRIPLITVTGTNGKTTTTRLIAHVVGDVSGQTVGMTSSEGIYIGGTCVTKGDTTGPRSAQTVLFDPEVDVAVLETARGGIVRSGLGYDLSDIAVVTNLQEDHIGQDGIQDIDDLMHIKSLVIERVRDGGTLVMNADDENVMRMLDAPIVRRECKQVVLFGIQNSRIVQEHVRNGGTAYYLEGDWIVEARGTSRYRVVRVTEVPLTLGGAARFNIANTLAATAACRAHGLSRKEIARALKTFESEAHNPGRGNLYQVDQGYVLVDYGHNPPAFEAVSELASSWRKGRTTGVIGVPGDRADRIIHKAGQVAARGFDRLFIWEDKDLRGRTPGETPELLRQAVLQEVPERECHVIPDTVEAVNQALKSIQPGEIVVVFFETLEPIQDLLKAYGAKAVVAFETQQAA